MDAQFKFAGSKLGIGLGNTTVRAYMINVCMWDSAMCKVRNLLRGKKSSKLSRYGNGYLKVVTLGKKGVSRLK